MGLAKETISREIRLGRLRHAKRAGRTLILGAWLLQWVRAGERRRGTAPTPLDRLRRAWEKAGPGDRAAFLAEVGKV
jgi:hypothetical protein